MDVDLSKGQSLSLPEIGDGGLSTVRMGLGWQAARSSKGLFARLIGGGADVDLDASAVLFSGSTAEDVVYFRKLTSTDGSVTHTGDNLTGGAGEEDNESIVVELTRVPAAIDQIVFTVSCFTGQTFARVERAFCRLVDEDSGKVLARFSLAGGGGHTALIMAKVRRQDGGWRMTAMGAPASGRTLKDLLPSLVPLL